MSSCMHTQLMQVSAEARRGCHLPWSCSYRRLWATTRGHRELTSLLNCLPSPDRVNFFEIFVLDSLLKMCLKMQRLQGKRSWMDPQSVSLPGFSACNTVILAGDSVKLAFSFLVKSGLDLVIVTPFLILAWTCVTTDAEFGTKRLGIKLHLDHYSSVTLSKDVNLSWPQFPHLKKSAVFCLLGFFVCVRETLGVFLLIAESLRHREVI